MESGHQVKYSRLARQACSTSRIGDNMRYGSHCAVRFGRGSNASNERRGDGGDLTIAESSRDRDDT